MNVTIKVGDVTVKLDDVVLSTGEVKRLLRTAAGLAVALAPRPPEPSAPIGFAAHVERLPDEMADITYEDED